MLLIAASAALQRAAREKMLEVQQGDVLLQTLPNWIWLPDSATTPPASIFQSSCEASPCAPPRHGTRQQPRCSLFFSLHCPGLHLRLRGNSDTAGFQAMPHALHAFYAQRRVSLLLRGRSVAAERATAQICTSHRQLCNCHLSKRQCRTTALDQRPRNHGKSHVRILHGTRQLQEREPNSLPYCPPHVSSRRWQNA